jgi:hypothetical protein
MFSALILPNRGAGVLGLSAVAHKPSAAAMAHALAPASAWRGSPQGADARRERVGVVLNDVVQLFDQGGGFVVCLDQGA